MNKILAFSILGIVLLIIIIFFIKRKKKEDNNSMEELIILEDENNIEISQNKEPKINITAVNFKVFGNEDKYTISFKGDRIQFFVKDGEIVGFLDKDKSNNIYYFKNVGDQNV
ncbi:LPXTG cell wall anchor domain-containing protein [Fusobacterium polymorphum]